MITQIRGSWASFKIAKGTIRTNLPELARALVKDFDGWTVGRKRALGTAKQIEIAKLAEGYLELYYNQAIPDLEAQVAQLRAEVLSLARLRNEARHENRKLEDQILDLQADISKRNKEYLK